MRSSWRFLIGAVLLGAPVVAPLARAETGAPVASEGGGPAVEAYEPALPSEVQPGSSVVLPVEGDKPVLVVHAPAANRRAIVYLHGMCGNLRAVETWKAAAAQHGTLIGLLGDKPCGAGRFKWSKKVDPIQARIERAVTAVHAARGGLLDTVEVVLFGYSQGADRAAVLARKFPGRYRRVVLGGPSHQPRLENLGDTLAVAVFGGEFETTWHMRAGAEVLSAAGKPARFFLLPSAKHGEYGPEGSRVLDEVLSWVVEAPGG